MDRVVVSGTLVIAPRDGAAQLLGSVLPPSLNAGLEWSPACPGLGEGSTFAGAFGAGSGGSRWVCGGLLALAAGADVLEGLEEGIWPWSGFEQAANPAQVSRARIKELRTALAVWRMYLSVWDRCGRLGGPPVQSVSTDSRLGTVASTLSTD